MTGLRFLIVGATCALLHNMIMIGGDFAGLHYAASNVISYCVVVVAGYLLHRAFTFRATAHNSSFPRYAVAMMANLPLSIAVMFVLVDLLEIPVWMAAPIATVLLFVWNFTASRWAIVRNTAGDAR